MENSLQPKKKLQIDPWLTAALCLVAVAISAALFPWNILDKFEFFGFNLKISDYSALGGFIGGVTTPFLSLAAFLLLYRTYRMQKEELETQRLFLEQQTALMKEQQQLMTKDLNVTLQRDFDRGFRDLIDIVETKSHHIQEMFARINQTRTSPHHACMYFLLEQSSLSYSIERFRKNLILDLEANSFLSSLCSLVHYIDTDSRYLGNFHRSLLQAKIASAHWQAVILYLIYIGDDYGFSTINTIQRYALAHRHLSSKFLEYLHTLCPEAFDILAVAADESATAKVL